MSEATRTGRPWPELELPGFLPDAIGFACRTTLALLLAYGIAFWAQLASASSAGLCVAIVAQPSPGMALSKAIYRVAGTIIGGIAAVTIVGLFPQDRTMLLATAALWLTACTFTAALLRDFRSYGAVLAGYTVGIIAISDIDAPQMVLLTALDRVAAILLGIATVGLVNTVFAGTNAYDGLRTALRRQLGDSTAFATDALSGRAHPDAVAAIHRLPAIIALQTEATYAGREMAQGRAREAGARSAVAALLQMTAASRAIAHGLELGAPSPAVAVFLRGATAAMEQGQVPPTPPAPANPHDTFLLERSSALLEQHGFATAGLHTLEHGGIPRRIVSLALHRDVVGAALSTARTLIAVAAGSVFCVLAGWPGATGLLVQQSAFTALLGLAPNPSRGAVAIAASLPVAALFAGVGGYILLPVSSGFVPFAIVAGTLFFILALASRHGRLTAYGPGALLYFTLLLAPSSPPAYDFSGFVNNLMVQVLALLFMLASFRLVFPVSPARRLARLAAAIGEDLRRTLLHGHADDPLQPTRQFDRLAQLLTWLDRRTPARRALIERLYAFAELDLALRRAWAGLDRAEQAAPALAPLLEPLRSCLINPEPAPLAMAAARLLAAEVPAPARPGVLEAVSGLQGAQAMLGRQQRALWHYGVLVR